MNRRSFLKFGALASGVMLLPVTLQCQDTRLMQIYFSDSLMVRIEKNWHNDLVTGLSGRVNRYLNEKNYEKH